MQHELRQFYRQQSNRNPIVLGRPHAVKATAQSPGSAAEPVVFQFEILIASFAATQKFGSYSLAAGTG
jgi:hypothetical protein